MSALCNVTENLDYNSNYFYLLTRNGLVDIFANKNYITVQLAEFKQLIATILTKFLYL